MTYFLVTLYVRKKTYTSYGLLILSYKLLKLENKVRINLAYLITISIIKISSTDNWYVHVSNMRFHNSTGTGDDTGLVPEKTASEKVLKLCILA